MWACQPGVATACFKLQLLQPTERCQPDPWPFVSPPFPPVNHQVEPSTVPSPQPPPPAGSVLIAPAPPKAGTAAFVIVVAGVIGGLVAVVAAVALYVARRRTTRLVTPEREANQAPPTQPESALISKQRTAAAEAGAARSSVTGIGDVAGAGSIAKPSPTGPSVGPAALRLSSNGSARNMDLLGALHPVHEPAPDGRSKRQLAAGLCCSLVDHGSACCRGLGV
jgi:hypothetical protein